MIWIWYKIELANGRRMTFFKNRRRHKKKSKIEDDIQKNQKLKTTSKISKMEDKKTQKICSLKFRGKPFLGLAQVTKIFKTHSTKCWGSSTIGLCVRCQWTVTHFKPCHWSTRLSHLAHTWALIGHNKCTFCTVYSSGLCTSVQVLQ
jgi:hypothetical protein